MSHIKGKPRGGRVSTGGTALNLAFGIVGAPTPELSKESDEAWKTNTTPGRVQIVGSLFLKNIDFSNSASIPEEMMERLCKNLQAIYEEGRYSSSRIVVDYRDGELYVSFPYNQSIVDRLKGLDRNERAWDPDSRSWRVFVGTFDDLFDILGKGLKLTEPAFKIIEEFIRSKYYAHVHRGKLGKLVIRESWFEDIISKDMSPVPVLFRSNANLEGDRPEELVGMEFSEVEQLVESWSFPRDPFAHQKVGVEFLLANSEAALLDEMGCGKSFQICCAVSMLFELGRIGRVLVVAPMSLLRTWQEELRLAGITDYSVIVGAPKKRLKALGSSAKVFLVHYEGLRMEVDALSEWLKQDPGMVVFDESQRIKNLQAQTTRAAQRVRQCSERCVIATGTPIANRPLDLFSQYLVLDKGKTFGTKFSAFKNSFCEMEIQRIAVGRRKITVEKFVGVKNGGELRRRILRTSLRRLKSQVLDLPPLIHKDYVLELRDEQKKMYQAMRDDLKGYVQGLSAEEINAEANSIVVKMLRLAQIASNPTLVDPNFRGGNAKLQELDMFLDDVFADDTKKVILWSHFVDNVMFLKNHFVEKYKAVAHTGEMSIEERQGNINAFRDDVETRLFVATPQSAKEGLTLLPRDGQTQADTMIYFDLNFDSGSYVQSQARFHRIGQTAEHCLIVHMVGENTIDEYILRALRDKIRTAKRLLDDEGNVAADVVRGVGRPLTREEILAVL